MPWFYLNFLHWQSSLSVFQILTRCHCNCWQTPCLVEIGMTYSCFNFIHGKSYVGLSWHFYCYCQPWHWGTPHPIDISRILPLFNRAVEIVQSAQDRAYTNNIYVLLYYSDQVFTGHEHYLAKFMAENLLWQVPKLFIFELYRQLSYQITQKST